MENLVIASEVLKTLKPNQAVIYSLLLQHPKTSEGFVALSRTQITELVRLSKDEVTAALGKLEDAGWLVSSPGVGFDRTHRYTLRGQP